MDSDKESAKAWEKVIEKETKGKEKSTPKRKSNMDKLLGVLTGENNEDDSSIFGFKVSDNDKKDRTNLIGELAKALDVQESKEQKRETKLNSETKKEPLFLLTDKQQSSKEERIDLSKPILPDKKPEVVLPEKPESPGIDEEKPVVPDLPVLPDDPNVPVLPDIPDIPVDPTPEPTPDPEPVPPVTPDEPDHTLDQLITTNKLALTTVKNKAEQLNQSLNQVKKELENLTMIEEKTAQTAEQATNEWQTVSDLVNEYNRLSQEIKKLIEVDGQVFSFIRRQFLNWWGFYLLTGTFGYFDSFIAGDISISAFRSFLILFVFTFLEIRLNQVYDQSIITNYDLSKKQRSLTYLTYMGFEKVTEDLIMTTHGNISVEKIFHHYRVKRTPFTLVVSKDSSKTASFYRCMLNLMFSFLIFYLSVNGMIEEKNVLRYTGLIIISLLVVLSEIPTLYEIVENLKQWFREYRKGGKN